MLLNSSRNLRLGALLLVFIAINQIDDPLVDPTIGQELLYWLVRIVVLAAGLWTADYVISRMPAERWARPVWLRPVVLVSIVGLVPFAVAEALIEPMLPIRPEYTDDDLRALSPVLVYLGEFVTILSILLPVHFLLWLILDRHTDKSADAPVDAAIPPFLERSAIRRLDDVLALQAEEHYVRIYTSSGADLVHYRFGDAIAELPDGLGLQVHRSWWVADTAVMSAKRGSRRWQLAITPELSVPVSDSYIGAVRERGWLKRKTRAPSEDSSGQAQGV
ncbi:MAG: LytTR family DNA-binding domain-containing protein [Pseudomonadota bacterium]